MLYIGFSRNNRQETYQRSLLNLKGTMNIDSFENWNQCNRRMKWTPSQGQFFS